MKVKKIRVVVWRIEMRLKTNDAEVFLLKLHLVITKISVM